MRTSLLAAVLLSLGGSALCGDVEISWTIPTSPDELTIATGDLVTFKWGGTHNIYLVETKEDFDSCTIGTDAKEVASTAKNEFSWLATAGTHYFVCQVGTHCALGQKVEITVVDAEPVTGGDKDCSEWENFDWSGFDVHCPKECTNDDNTLYPKCAEGQEEYGQQCKDTGTCASYLDSITQADGDYSCAGEFGGLLGLIIPLVKMACSETTCPLENPSEAWAMLMGFDIYCPKECTKDESELEKYSMCVDGQEEYGAKCQATNKCQSYLKEIDPYLGCIEGIGPLLQMFAPAIAAMCEGEEPVDLEQMMGGGEVGGGCVALYPTMLDLFNGPCAADCITEGMGKMSDDDPRVPCAGDPTWGKYCSAECGQAMEQLPMDEMVACELMDPNTAALVSMACNGCGDAMAMASQISTMCPKECSEDEEEIMEGMKRCGDDESEYGAKCKATDCAAKLTEFMKDTKGMDCISEMYERETGVEDFATGWLAHVSAQCDPTCGDTETALECFDDCNFPEDPSNPSDADCEKMVKVTNGEDACASDCSLDECAMKMIRPYLEGPYAACPNSASFMTNAAKNLGADAKSDSSTPAEKKDDAPAPSTPSTAAPSPSDGSGAYFVTVVPAVLLSVIALYML